MIHGFTIRRPGVEGSPKGAGLECASTHSARAVSRPPRLFADAPDFVIEARQLGKCYQLYERPADRLKQLVWGGRLRRGKPYYRDFWALKDVDFAIAPGEIVGIVGRNGAGKSTLLQLVCGTLHATTGQLSVRGRVAALLELGAGFNPDFTGCENIYMNAAIMGLTRAQVDERFDEIVAFADIGDFITQPVKTYSSGMYMRLAFAVATCVEPDILVIDEALSVGDGSFARKSFDRIMALKEAGKTILFCSHSMAQVEALCSRAMWIDAGHLRLAGPAAEVTHAYQSSLDAGIAVRAAPADSVALASDKPAPVAPGTGRIDRIAATADGISGRQLNLVCGQSDLSITLTYSIDPKLPAPTVAFGISDANSLTVASVLSSNDGIQLRIDEDGHGQATVLFSKLPLLKGRYTITAFLLSEDGLHLYEQVDRCLVLDVTQVGAEQGLVSLDREWRVPAAGALRVSAA
jgi:lipopolysaccharide transport system ATP-binding protein